MEHTSPDSILNHISPDSIMNHTSPGSIMNHTSPDNAFSDSNPTEAVKEKKKMGRPTTNPRTEKIGFRMSPLEIEDIRKCSEAMRTQRVNAVVEGIRLLKEKLKIDCPEQD